MLSAQRKSSRLSFLVLVNSFFYSDRKLLVKSSTVPLMLSKHLIQGLPDLFYHASTLYNACKSLRNALIVFWYMFIIYIYLFVGCYIVFSLFALNRDAFSRALYSRLFAWLVARINQSIHLPENPDSTSIAILDIFGFEVICSFITLWSGQRLCYTIWLAESVRMWRNQQALLSGNAAHYVRTQIQPNM